MEAVRDKGTHTFSKKYVIHHHEADFKIKIVKFVKKYGATLPNF